MDVFLLPAERWDFGPFFLGMGILTNPKDPDMSVLRKGLPLYSFPGEGIETINPLEGVWIV